MAGVYRIGPEPLKPGTAAGQKLPAGRINRSIPPGRKRLTGPDAKANPFLF